MLNEETQRITTTKKGIVNKVSLLPESYSKTDPVGAKVKVNSCNDISNSP